MEKVYTKPRVGKVVLDVHLKNKPTPSDDALPVTSTPESSENQVTPKPVKYEQVLKSVGGSIKEETFTLDSEHTYTFTVPSVDSVNDISGIAVQWIPTDKSTNDRLYPRGFVLKNLDAKEPRLRLCRRKASDGIVPFGNYVFRTKPQCFRDQDQTPPKEIDY